MQSSRKRKPAATSQASTARRASTSKKRKTDATERVVHPKSSTSRAGASGAASHVGGDDDDEDEEEEEGEEEDDEVEDACIKGSIKRALKALEEELGTTKGLLRRNTKILDYNVELEDGEEPRTAEVLVRIDSPTGGKKYIEVHFSYHSRSRMYSVEWFYTIGYKIFPGTGSSDSGKTTLAAFRSRTHASTYRMQGWRSIAYAFYDDDRGSYSRRWRRNEVFSVGLTRKGLLEVHDALWGPLRAPPPRASAADRTEHRRALVCTLRVLLAAVGIEYGIACEDGEVDVKPGGREQIAWVLEGAGDRWFARGVRKACGFQLERDPGDAAKGKQEREEQARGDDEEEDEDEDEDGEGSEEYE